LSPKAVEAVFFWRYQVTPYRAVYGRFYGTLYSKDFLQSPKNQWPIIDKILARAEGERVEVEYRWPGDKRLGHWRASAADVRGQLAWEHDNPPTPWRLGDPFNNPVYTIPGNGTLKSEVEAEQEWKRLEAKDMGPWILAIKLVGEPNVLHVRAYLERPPAGLAHRGLDRLPRPIWDAIRKLPSSYGGGAVELKPVAAVRARKLVARILETLKSDANVLLVGPPGTGKTVALEDLRALYMTSASEVTFDPDEWDAWSENAGIQGPTKVVSLVFHPSYTYEDFVAGLVPETEAGKLRLVARPGPLLSLSHWASENNRQALLLIDEFNRGPAAAIFGDMLAILDGSKRHDPARGVEGAAIERPHPRAVMEVGPGYEASGKKEVASPVRLPASVRIVAALNSTDRSVAPIDAALRRRFAIIHVQPDYEILAEHLGLAAVDLESPFAPSSEDPQQWNVGDLKNFTVRLLYRLNERIAFVLGQDFLLGHALFWSVGGTSAEEVTKSLVRAFDERVAASLRLTFLDQDEALGAILKAAGSAQAASIAVPAGLPRVARWLSPPPELQSVASPRLQVQVLSELAWPQALKALRELL
jgi:5-methylcytosine-specific restriction protein B